MRTKITVLAALAAFSMPAAANAAQLLTNGGFESGNLTGWTVTGGPATATGGCPFDGRNWNVSGSGSATGCSAVANPSAGSYAVYAMNDGVAGTSYVLSQDFLVASGITSTAFSFDLSSVSGYSGTPRTLAVDLLVGSALIGNLYTYTVPTSDFASTWSTISGTTNLLNSLGGQTATLRFTNAIPQSWTGAAGIGLDNISLNATVAAVPEPSTWAMMLVGFGFVGAMLRSKSRQTVRLNFA